MSWIEWSIPEYDDLLQKWVFTQVSPSGEVKTYEYDTEQEAKDSHRRLVIDTVAGGRE